MKTSLVLGGAGFIGARLVHALSAAGVPVRAFDRKFPDRNELADGSGAVTRIEGDFHDRANLLSALEGCSTVYHLISSTLPHTSNLDPIFDVRTNVLSTLQLLDLMRQSTAKRLVFASSGGTVYGQPQSIPIRENHPTDPISSYGIAKLTIEKYLHLYELLHGLSYVTLRLANPFGPGQSASRSQGAVGVFLGRALDGLPIDVWGDGSVVRDYVYIDDVVRALILAGDYQGSERVFNVGAGRGLSINELIQCIESVIGKTLPRRHHPAREGDVQRSVLDISLADAELGWRPEMPFAIGLQLTANWLGTRASTR
jgi:UDP-glucose 4-epimerase